MISIIVAIDEKRGIGKNNDLLFRIPEDFQRMKTLTNGHPLVMGRRTFESIGRVLPNRTNIIITQNSKLKIQNSVVVNSLEEGIEMAKKSPGADEIFIFGGGQIFKQAIEENLVDRLYLTIVEGDFGADTFFPDYSNFKKVISEEQHESGDYKFRFLTLER
jgi:dihydrofolate reductase